MLDQHFENESKNFLVSCFGDVTSEIIHLKPSEWAEKKRYLPAHTTPKSGYFRFAVAPYLKEIVDCFDPYSEVREVDFMKGAQVCATVGVLENIIGYSIDYLKNAPVMFLTADGELAKQRFEINIIPMINYSNLSDRISSADEENSRKTGKTEKRIEWVGGGFLVGFGAKNADKLRSQSIKILLEDEVDAYPDTVGKDGDPQKLAEARTKAYYESRKIFRNSTPLIDGNSRIDKGFKQGDQRYYNVPCKACGLMQVLKFQGSCKETGHVYGLVWDYLENGALDMQSVRYICKNPDCGAAHTNEDKTIMLANGKWVPTAVPSNPKHRSYHLSALYSPVGFYSWAAIVADWLEAWDIKKGVPKDNGLLQEFYNNNLGETFQLVADRLRFEHVSPHRRTAYHFGEVPNEYAIENCGSRILVVTAAVDVQENYLSVAAFGWSKWSTAWLLDYIEIEGPTDDIDSMFSPWVKLYEYFNDKTFVSDDGFEYKIALALVDSGYRSATVYQFCNKFENWVYPIKGRKQAKRASIMKEFAPMETSLGVTGYMVTVDLYKDRWQAALKREWLGVGEMPRGHFNAPVDISDNQLKELTAESKRMLVDPQTKKVVGTEWHRKQGAKNELWDLLNYNNAAVDMIAQEVCRQQFGLESVNVPGFWDYLESDQVYFNPAK